MKIIVIIIETFLAWMLGGLTFTVFAFGGLGSYSSGEWMIIFSIFLLIFGSLWYGYFAMIIKWNNNIYEREDDIELKNSNKFIQVLIKVITVCLEVFFQFALIMAIAVFAKSPFFLLAMIILLGLYFFAFLKLKDKIYR